MIIPVFIPHGGCPEKCKFCDQSVSGGTPIAKKDLIQTIDTYLKTVQNNEKVQVAFYGGTFTALSQSLQLQYLDIVKTYIDQNLVQSVRIATRPDAIDKDWIQCIQKLYNVTTIELGVQSFDENVLRTAGRSHSISHIIDATNILKELNIQIGFHLMIGLPNENENSDNETIQWVQKLKPDMVRIHPLVVIEGTEFYDEVLKNQFVPITLDQAIERAANLTIAFEDCQVKVIRLGLQANDLLNQNVMSGGAYHPAFGEMVRGRVLAKKIKNNNLVHEWQNHVSDKEHNLLKAHGNLNMNWMLS